MVIWKQEVYGTGRCINCGYLGKRDQISSVSICYEATAVDRQSGILTETSGQPIGIASIGKRPHIATWPWCFVGKANFLKELEDIGAKAHEAEKMREIIEKDRACPSWYPWREFATPAEHFQESIMLAMEQRREKFELRLEEFNRQERRRTNKVMIWLTIALIIFAALQVYAALASINPEHWLFRWLR